jgi:hypothetical protein
VTAGDRLERFRELARRIEAARPELAADVDAQLDEDFPEWRASVLQRIQRDTARPILLVLTAGSGQRER